MFDLNSLYAARDIVYTTMPATPQYAWPLLANRLGCEVWVKHENHTPTGAFKIRGGLVFIHQLVNSNKEIHGLVTATRGNHGQSLAFSAQRAGVPLHIVVPTGNSLEKNAAMKAMGANVVEYGQDFDTARAKAAELAIELKLDSVPAFHSDLVRGVATYALELFQAVNDLDTVYVPIGMGSGICGMIKTRDLLGLHTEIVGVVSSEADAFAQSFECGKIMTTETANTLADGLACRMPLPEAFEIIRQGAARIVRVSDEEICHAIRVYHEDTHNLAEGAGAAALAALIQEKQQQKGKKVGVILSGGNIDRQAHAEILR